MITKVIHKPIFTIILISILSISSYVTPVYANSADTDRENFLINNNIRFYDGKDKKDPCVIGSNTLFGSEITEKIWNYLTSLRGLTEEQAAGIMGNMWQETGGSFSPTIHQGDAPVHELEKPGYNGNAWGIVQWDGGRRSAILKKLKLDYPELYKYVNLEYDTNRNRLAKIPEADLNKLLMFELNYMYEESMARPVSKRTAGKFPIASGLKEWDGLKQMTSINDATVFWHDNFEVSADSTSKVLNVRGKYSKTIYDKYHNKSSTSSSSVTYTSDECEPQLGDFESYVKNYSWTDEEIEKENSGIRYGFIKLKDAYRKAMDSAPANRYTGGGDGGKGVDCGGFVTNLIIDSKFDQNYNYEGNISKGAGSTIYQKKWLDANWKKIGNGASINVADLQPGDVAMEEGHTFVYVGGIEGYKNRIASASIGSSANNARAPMSGTESLVSSTITWYRKQ